MLNNRPICTSALVTALFASIIGLSACESAAPVADSEGRAGDEGRSGADGSREPAPSGTPQKSSPSSCQSAYVHFVCVKDNGEESSTHGELTCGDETGEVPEEVCCDGFEEVVAEGCRDMENGRLDSFTCSCADPLGILGDR